jgi:hypothetical protein
MTTGPHRQQAPHTFWNLRSAVSHRDGQSQADLARFVLEDLPDVAALVERARHRLEPDLSFCAYSDRDSVTRQVRAIFETLQEQRPISSERATRKGRARSAWASFCAGSRNGDNCCGRDWRSSSNWEAGRSVNRRR